MKPQVTNTQHPGQFVNWRTFARQRAAFICLLLPLLAWSPHTYADLNDGLIAYYPFNGDWDDHSGHPAANLTNYGATLVSGIVGQAANLDGSTYLAAEDSALFHFGTNDLTIAVWIKAPLGSGVRTFIGKEQTWGDAPSFQFRLLESGVVEFFVVDNGHLVPNTRLTVRSPGRLDDNQFHHLVGVRTAVGYALYIDGQLAATVSEPAHNSDNPVRLLIGGQYETAPGSATDLFTGLIDEVRLYNRALSAVEVGQLWGGLAAYYPFNGNANDASGNSNNPVAITGVTYTTDRFGITNTAALFDGNGDINYGTNALPQTGQGSFSVSFWILAGVQDGYVIGNKNGGFDPGPYWAIQCEDTAQDGLGVRLDLSDGTHYTPSIVPNVTTGGGVFGDWHHVCMVVDRLQQKATAYLDGAKQGSFDISQFGSVHNASALRMGWRGDWFKLNARLDEVFIFNRVLSGAEIIELATEPRLSIACSQVRLCWSSRSNKTYQVQYRSTLTTNTWLNFGSPIPGNGSTQCITDEIVGPQKFYRAIMLP